MIGAHHPFKPKRSIALGPSFVTTSMIVPAQRNALSRFSEEKWIGLATQEEGFSWRSL